MLFELTQVNGVYLKQFHAYGDPDRVKDHKDELGFIYIAYTTGRRVITVGYFDS